MASVKINIGGTIFQTTVHTLSMSNYFAAYFQRWVDNPDEIPFIDRNPRIFDHVLSLMRDPHYPYPDKYRSELEYFGIILKEPTYRYRYVSLNTYVRVNKYKTFIEVTPINDLKKGDILRLDKDRSAVVAKVKRGTFYHSNLVRYKGIILSSKRSQDEESCDEEIETPLDEEPLKMMDMVRVVVMKGSENIPIYDIDNNRIMDLEVEQNHKME